VTTAEMIRGLVRAAEMIEQRDGGTVWDNEVRKALYAARDLGWKNGKAGVLQLELPDAPPFPQHEPWPGDRS
jgi:hypothetical protein